MTTIVVPVLDGAHVLPLTMDAVLAQPADRIVYVDDGSTDATPELLDDLARKDARVVVLTNVENQGRAASRNRGASGASGLLVFLDADVAPHPGYLRAMQRTLAAPEAVAAVGVLSFPEANPRDPYHRYLTSARRGPGVVKGTVPWRFFIACVGTVRAEAFHRAGGFPESIPYGEDIALACLLSQASPSGLRRAPEAHADMFDIGDLDAARSKLAGFARDLEVVQRVCPGALNVAGLNRLQSSGVGSRAMMKAARWSLPAQLLARVVSRLPAGLQPLAVRYLLGHTLAANARLS